MSYQQQFYPTGLAPVNEPTTQFVKFEQKNAPTQVYTTHIPMVRIQPALNPITTYNNPRFIQVQQAQPVQPVQYVTGGYEQLNISLPQPVQTENITPIKYEPEPAQQTDNKKVTNNINITVNSEEKTKTLCCKTSHTCMGIIIGVAVTIIIVVALVIGITVIKRNVKSLTNFTTKKVNPPRASFNCPDGFTGISCNIDCADAQNSVLRNIEVYFEYKKVQNMDGKMFTITEKRSFFGLLIGPASIVVAKHNLVQTFDFNYGTHQYTVNVEPNQFNPTYGSMYNVWKYGNGNFGGVAEIIQNDNADLAILKLFIDYKYLPDNFDIKCVFYSKPDFLYGLIEMSSDVFYNNTLWIEENM